MHCMYGHLVTCFLLVYLKFEMNHCIHFLGYFALDLGHLNSWTFPAFSKGVWDFWADNWIMQCVSVRWDESGGSKGGREVEREEVI